MILGLRILSNSIKFEFNDFILDLVVVMEKNNFFSNILHVLKKFTDFQ
jgi:hypothetical protein